MKFTRIAITYMIKYFLGFLAVFAGSLLVFIKAQNSIENYVIKQAQLQTREGIQAVEEAIEKMDLISRMMQQNNNFTELVYQGEASAEEKVMQLRNSNNFMTKIGSVADYTPYMFVLFKNNDLYLSSDQCDFSFQKYYGRFLKLTLPELAVEDGSQLKELLLKNGEEGRRFQRLQSIRFVRNDMNQELQEAVIYQVNAQNTIYDPLYVFCFVLSREYLVSSIMMSDLREDGFLYIQDMKTGETLLEYGDVPEIAHSCGDGDQIEGGNRYHAIVTVQKGMNLKVVTGVPMSYSEEQMKPVKNLLLLYLWLGLTTVIVLTLYFSFARYYGFRKVLLTFPEEELSDGKKSTNDYELLRDHVSRMHEKGRAYQMQIEELERRNRAILLENTIVNGIRSEAEKQAFYEYFGKEPEFFSVILVRMMNADGESTGNAAIDMLYFLKQADIRLWGNVHSGVFDELFLIELSPLQEPRLTELLKTMEDMAAFISENYDMNLHVGLSTVGTGLENIHRCYEYARRIVQAQHVFENENMVQAYDITASALHENPVNVEFLNGLYNMLLCGQETLIIKSFDQAEGCYERMPYLYEICKEQIFYSVRNVFYTAALHLNCEIYVEDMPAYAQDMKCMEMMDIFGRTASRICGYIEQKKKSKNEELRESILRFIEEHFQDPDLSAAGVSRQMGISEKYLYQFIKEQTGETFMAHLLSIRVDKAREYLEQTDYSNEQIAVRTGFLSVSTFYRNFSRQTGVSPRTYRETRR